MTNSSQHCPSGLRQHTDSNAKSHLVLIALQSISISNHWSIQECVERYEATKLVHRFVQLCDYWASTKPNNNYVDGISLTHGHPRHHIWTFAAALDEVGTVNSSNCPCINTNLASRATPPPAYMDNVTRLVYNTDPLWDGTHAAPSTTLHGSTSCCYSPPLTT